jgi:hypothetical protein
MNEAPKQNKSEKESFVTFGFLLVVMSLGLLAGILKLVGLF